MADIRVCSHGQTSPCDECQLLVMLNMRKELDPDAPNAVVIPTRKCQACGHPTVSIPYCVTCSVTMKDAAPISAMREAQRLADCVVDAAIEWHTSGIDNMEQCFDKAGILGAAIDELIDFRRKMPIVKNR